jgi:hypothetical protein
MIFVFFNFLEKKLSIPLRITIPLIFYFLEK